MSDNGPGYKSDLFARFIRSWPWLAHIRTRYRSPQTNGVIERFYGSIKYDDLYRHEIADGMELNTHCEDYRQLYNEIRHEEIDFYPPTRRYLDSVPISFDEELSFLEPVDDDAGLSGDRPDQ